MELMTEVPLRLGEQLAWTHELKHGVLHREVVMVLAISNMRVFQYDLANNSENGYPINQISIAVMNERRESTGLSYGTYYGSGVGAFNSMRTGTSHPIGDLVFTVDGKVVMEWRGLNDPHGIVNLVRAIQKQENHGV